jgi:hypothetical protein
MRPKNRKRVCEKPKGVSQQFLTECRFTLNLTLALSGSASALTAGLHSRKVTQAAVSRVNFGLAGKLAEQNYSTGLSNLVMEYFLQIDLVGRSMPVARLPKSTFQGSPAALA